MLGTMLDLDDSVKAIVRWIEDHGGFEKTALYVTADHDHYLTLLNDFPETLATLLIDGASHNITPRNNSHVNPWTAAGTAAIQATAGGGKSDDSIIQHLKTFATWTEEDMANVSHFWGPRGSGGNGWAWHTSRPVPLFHRGDEDCIDSLVGKGFQVLGRDVAATSPNKVDQMHLHACLLKHMLAL
jgi:alkaline phosphatase